MSKTVQIGKLTSPGETICAIDKSLIPGAGVAIFDSRYVSVVRGNIHLSVSDSENIQTLSVLRNEKKTVGINLEDEVLARVVKIKDE